MPDALWHFSGQAIALLAGAFTLWALFADRAKGRKRCRKCWYDLASLGDVPITCPECGKAHTKPKHLKRTRRRRRLAILGLLVMLVGGYGLWVVPRVQDEGRYGLVPGWSMPWVSWHVRINRFPPTDRWQQAYLSLANLFERDDHHERAKRSVQWWLRLGLVDPAGYYGRTGFKTSADVMADPYGFSYAGVVFQSTIHLTDLPRWARHARIENELSEISLTGTIEPGESGLQRAAIQGGATPFDSNAGTDDWTVEIRTSNPEDGALVIRSFLVEVFESDFFQQAGMTEQERIDAGWTIEKDPFGQTTMRPPPLLILHQASPGEFPARVTAAFMGETVGVYDAILVPDPSAGGMFPQRDYLRVQKLDRVDD